MDFLFQPGVYAVAERKPGQDVFQMMQVQLSLFLGKS